MDIKTMLKREDFYEIFKDTYENYSNTHNNENVEIIFHDNKLKGNYVCYEKLNVITRRLPIKEHVSYALSEYNVRGNIIKYIAAKIWVLLNFTSLGLASGKSLSILGNEENNECLIWPCNRSIRLFNFNNGTVTSIVKKGFPKITFDNSIKFRMRNSYDFIPPLLDYGENWFKEPILPGKALARVKDNRLYSRGIKKALESVKLLNENTKKLIDVVEYTQQIEQNINKKIEEAKEVKKINTEQLLKSIVKNLLTRVKQFNCSIPVALTHGDLQTGNIWVNDVEGKVYVIDWETNAYRSVWYDPATLLCSLRRKSGLENLIENRNSTEMIRSLLINDEVKEYGMDMVAGIIILEDIAFYLDDLLSLPHENGSEGFDSKVREISELSWGQ